MSRFHAIIAIILVAVSPAARTAAAEPVVPAIVTLNSLHDYQQSLIKACQTNADCVVKNVGNCCGYAPQCVHQEVPTFPEQVKGLCAQEGRSSICGFQEPAGCACVDNQCQTSTEISTETDSN